MSSAPPDDLCAFALHGPTSAFRARAEVVRESDNDDVDLLRAMRPLPPGGDFDPVEAVKSSNPRLLNHPLGHRHAAKS
jgi:hypothetical protein